MSFSKYQTGIESNGVLLAKIEGLITDIITQKGISFYNIISEIKDGRTDVANNNNSIAVVRIISYFQDSVNQIADILRREFDITTVNSNSGSQSWADSFSSEQVHFAVTLKANRLSLTEYLNVPRFEIQVSSILQEAWISMSRGLNQGQPIPEGIKRDFYRVGAFLEMADLEFSKIKKQITQQDNGNIAAPIQQNNYQPVEETPQQPAAAPAAPPVAAEIPAPQEIAPAAPVITEIPKTEHTIDSMDVIDIHVENLDAVAMKVNTIENKNGISDEVIAELVNIAPETTPAEEIETKPTSSGASADNGGMALNIDTVQNFNMNVNGMIERTTEIIREVPLNGADKDAALPAAEKPKSETSQPLDENAQMTDVSLKEFVMQNKLIKEVDLQIAERAGAKLNEDIDIEGDVERLRFLKVFTLKQLQERIADNKSDIVAFAEKWIGKDNGGTFDSGICLFYLEYLLVGKKNDPAFAVEYVLKFISDNDYSARYIIPTYNSIKTTAEPSNFSHLTLK